MALTNDKKGVPIMTTLPHRTKDPVIQAGLANDISTPKALLFGTL
jgi:hypothetical protein